MTCQTKNVNAATAVHVNVKAVAKLRGRNGFDGVESGGECKQGRYALDSSNTIIANNNYFYESARLAA